MSQDTDANRTSYDKLAEEYTRHIADELKGKPFDRELLDRFASLVEDGKVYDIGCGPGHVSRYLFDRSVDVTGADLSPAMIAQARQLNPGLNFVVADMTRLDVADNALAGIIAFYSIIHIPKAQVVSVLQGFIKALKPGGCLLLSFHRGDETRHFDEMWGAKVNLDFIFFEKTEMEGFVQEAGFEIVESIERAPYPEVEVATQRVYLLARKTL